MGETAYLRLKRLGVDMGWYEKRTTPEQRTKAIPLTDDRCCLLSIYYLDKTGALYTTTTDGEPYEVVRESNKPIAKPIYVCAHCKVQFKTYPLAKAHYEEADDEGKR